MLKKNVITCTLALAFAASTAAAQTSSSGSSQQTPSGTSSTTSSEQSTSQTSSTSQAGTTTLTGCVYEEKDVPGRSPNVAEQAGMLEDYILAVDTSATAGTAGSTATGTTGAAGHKMFKLEHASDEKLKDMVGKRVEVTGRIDAEAGDRPTGTAGADESAGPDRKELPEFEVTSIREVSGSCPAKPSAQ